MKAAAAPIVAERQSQTTELRRKFRLAESGWAEIMNCSGKLQRFGLSSRRPRDSGPGHFVAREGAEVRELSAFLPVISAVVVVLLEFSFVIFCLKLIDADGRGGER